MAGCPVEAIGNDNPSLPIPTTEPAKASGSVP
jgi:hypothetical protein